MKTGPGFFVFDWASSRAARNALDEQSIQDEDISRNECRFYHVEPTDPVVAEAIPKQGHCIIKLQGCEEK